MYESCGKRYRERKDKDKAVFWGLGYKTRKPKIISLAEPLSLDKIDFPVKRHFLISPSFFFFSSYEQAYMITFIWATGSPLMNYSILQIRV